MTKERLNELLETSIDAAKCVNEAIQEIEQSKQPILRRKAALLNGQLREAVQTLQYIELD